MTCTKGYREAKRAAGEIANPTMRAIRQEPDFSLSSQAQPVRNYGRQLRQDMLHDAKKAAQLR